jgi:uncharacterized repeat protein (TIGR03943 family)
VKRETENLLLLLVGVSIAMITVGGVFTRYVKPSLLPWLAATAVLLVVLALVAVVGDIRRGGPRRGDDDGHSHGGGVAWLLVVPIVLLIFVTPPALQANSATAPVATGNTAALTFAPLPAGPAPEVSLPDVVMRAANDKSASLHDRLITVTGFVLHESYGLDLGRIVIICCAADAQLARIHLHGPGLGTAAGFADNTWLRMQGKVTPAVPRPDQSPIPTLDVVDVVAINAPPNPYAYPS